MKPRKVLYICVSYATAFVFLGMFAGWFGWEQNRDQALVWLALGLAAEAKAERR